MRFAIADPPYPGMAHFYKDHPDYDGEVDHQALINKLVGEYPDGWALCTASTTLQRVLADCPAGVRVGAWVKTWGGFKPGVNPAYVWEPVIFRGGRTKRSRQERTVTDWHAAPATVKKSLAGAKPPSFCFWLFALLGALPDDEIIDLFPGTGAVSRAWESYRQQVRLPLTANGKQGKLIEATS